MVEAWNKAAEVRRQQIESGVDITFCSVFIPYFEEIVNQLNPTTVLEVGCGTGHLSAKLASKERKIQAIDTSENMCSLASQILNGKFVKLKKCSIENFTSTENFDLILSHMCVQTISDLDAFFSSISYFLSYNSTFIFSLPHPCFYNKYKRFFKDSEYIYMKPNSKSITLTITKDPERPIADIPYNHRPLSHYIKALKSSGMCLKDMDEIFPSKPIQMLYGKQWKEPRYLVIHATLDLKQIERHHEY